MIKINDVDKYIGMNGVIIVDLRKSAEYQSGHIKGAVSIPYEPGKNIARYVQGYRYIFLYCQRGSLSMLVSKELSSSNMMVYNLCGGLRAYYGKLIKS
jgi:rhodanese-related sulfurtransferase